MVENLANVVIQDMKIWHERGKFFKHHGLIETNWKEKPLSYDDLIVKRNLLQSRCYLWVKICRDLSSTQNSYHSDYTNRFLPPLVEEKESMPNAENNPEYRKKLSLMACDTLIFCRDITQQITPVLVMLHAKDTSCLKSLNALIEHYDTMALLSLDETKSGFDMLNTEYKKAADEIIIQQPESKSDSESAPTSDLPTINKTESKKKKRMSGSLPYFFKDNSK
ncbi:MAG: hypothetical protein K2X98_03475 [Alphaproteobacteria bacterium]|nr:hypothetical protein [Alphaproteobacteria bacterium]